MSWIGFLLCGALLAFALWYVTRYRPRCPDCSSYEVSEVKKEPRPHIIADTMATGGENSHTVASNIYNVTYQCDECRKSWMVTRTESH